MPIILVAEKVWTEGKSVQRKFKVDSFVEVHNIRMKYRFYKCVGHVLGNEAVDSSELFLVLVKLNFIRMLAQL